MSNVSYSDSIGSLEKGDQETPLHALCAPKHSLYNTELTRRSAAVWMRMVSLGSSI